jgi:hypothetical protein
VADDHHAVGDADGPPVAPRGTDREQVDRDYVLSVLGQQVVETLVARDPGPLGPLEDARGVVAPLDWLRDPPVRDGFRPG